MKPLTNNVFKHQRGVWAKTVKGKTYYFGRIDEDETGDKAVADWLRRKDAILSGLDGVSGVRLNCTVDAYTLNHLSTDFLKACRAKSISGELSPATYGDYSYEIPLLVAFLGKDAVVSDLKPDHFQAYGNHLVNSRKLGRHARRRVIAYCKAMFNWGAKNDRYLAPSYGTGFVAPDTSKDAMRQAKARAGVKDHSTRILTGDELDKLLDATTPLFKGIILLSVNCGLGPADLGRLRWRDIDLNTGALNMPRGKTGTDRRGYVWKKTRKALARVATLKHNRLAIAKDGQDALVFVTRKAMPMYREIEQIEDGRSVGVKICNSISGTFGKLARSLKLEGVTQYRLRHTFKTLGKKARDPDALNLMMGHKDGTTGEIYDHEEIEFSRMEQVSKVVFRQLWPRQKQPGKSKRSHVAA